MKNEGWTWGDLMGELWARGIDPDEIALTDAVLAHSTPESAAVYIEAELAKQAEGEGE